jgi:benzodiazapine receptor
MLRGLLPFLLITGTSALCPNLPSAGEAVPFRPPPWVFGVVWPILYYTTGYAWELSRLDVPFSLVIGLCCLWLLVYACRGQKKLAASVIAASAIMAWATVLRLEGNARVAMLPLALWLTFATYLNAYEVRKI